MKLFRQAGSLLMIFALLLSLGACGHDSPSVSSSSSVATLPEPSVPIVATPPTDQAADAVELSLIADPTLEEAAYRLTDLPRQSEAAELFTARRCGDTLAELYRQYDPTQESFFYQIFWNGESCQVPSDFQLVSSLFWAEDRGCWAVCTQTFSDDPEPMLCLWSWDGTQVLSQPLGTLLDDSQPCDIMVTEESLLLLTDTTLLQLNDNLELVDQQDFSDLDTFGVLAVSPEGSVYCYRNGLLSAITLDPLSLQAQYTISSLYSVYSGAGDHDLFLTGAEGLYGVDLSTGEARELLYWENANLTNPDLFLGQEDGNYQILQTNPFSLDYEILSIEPLSPEEAVQKTEVVLATLENEYTFADSTTYAAIQYFNQRSDLYHVSVVYYSGSSALEMDAQLQQLKLDILTGKQIDLLLTVNYDVYPFLAQGLLEDLYPWLDADPDLDRTDLSPSLLEAMDLDGKLYFCATAYNVISYVGLRSQLGHVQGWDLWAFAQAVRSVNPEEVTPIADTTGASFLYQYMLYCYDHFVDETNGTCQFDSEEFRLLLELCRDSFPDQPRSGSILDGTALLERAQTSPIFTLLAPDLAARGTEDLILAGFPGAGGNGGVVQRGFDTFAMLSVSSNQEGAWEFLKFLWSPTAQSQTNFSCPALLEAMDDELNKQVEDYGNLTEAEAALTRDYYLGATAHESMSYAIVDIVAEECQALLAGDKSIDDTIAIIQNRVMIYLSEQS